LATPPSTILPQMAAGFVAKSSFPRSMSPSQLMLRGYLWHSHIVPVGEEEMNLCQYITLWPIRVI
jgi:hypothetical protein